MQTFHLEISSFLKELKCPYSQINESSTMKQNERFLSRENKLLLLSYLCSELQAASILAINKPSPIDHTTQSSIVCNLSLSLSVILFL